MPFSRRSLLRSAYAAALSYSALPLVGEARAYTANKRMPLKADPRGLLDLPAGFSYTLASETGGIMSDGFFRPGRPDGMACFAHPNDADKCVLMRNHENWPDTADGGPFGDDNALAGRLSGAQLYDRKPDGAPFLGGVTAVIYDLKSKKMDRDFLVLAGTTGNCAGGATPWGSWLSCEESAITAPNAAGKNHGFVFETPSTATGVIDAVPLKAMGRFVHEAASVDHDTGVVYLTEDSMTGLFYRFLPNTKGELHKGGRLQALSVKGWSSADTRNWPRDWSSDAARPVAPGETFDVEWIDLENVEAPEGDLAARGHADGAAIFCRGEGMAFGRDKDGAAHHYFNCTQGGAARAGQVWRYTPGRDEGHSDETGKLTLFYESPTPDVLDLNDNLAFSPWGDLILCEDGFGDQFLRGLTPSGEIYDIARNAHGERAEFCGACFSPDGETLFVNVQSPGFTFAVRGPWANLRNS